MFIIILFAVLIPSNLVESRPREIGNEGGICEGKKSGERVPDPHSCEGFYKCNEGEAPTLVICPPGLWFDRITLTCTFPEIAVCELETEETTSPTEEQTTNKETTTATTEEETTTSVTETSTETDTTTISATMTTTTVPVTTTTGQPTTTTTTITHTTNTAPGIPIDPEATAEPGVEEQCNEMDREQMNFIPSKVACERYYLCYRGKPVELNCISGQHWNQYETFCDDPFYAHCQAEGWVDPNPFPECPRLGRVLRPHRTDCSYFIYCNDGVGFLNRCPLHEGWDSILQKCVLKSEARCYVHSE